MGRDYWRSLEEREGDPTSRLEPELLRVIREELPPASRRSFLKLMGGSLGLAGLTSCRWPRELIVPFHQRPEGRTPGVPERFATIMEMGGAALGLLVTSVDGRPVKVEGNPDHPASLGGTHLWAQAAILELYDPDRSRQVLHQGKPSSWEAFAAFAAERRGQLLATRGRDLAVVVGESSSPTIAALRARAAERWPESLWATHEPWSWHRQALATGELPQRWVLHLEKARVVVCLDADILSAHPDAVRHARELAGTRRGGESASRLYAAEAALSLTGAAADHRLPVSAGEIARLALHLLDEVARAGVAVPGELLSGEPLPPLPDPARAFVRAAASDLVRQRGSGLVVAGAGQTVAHRLALVLNQVLGSVGSTLTLRPLQGLDAPGAAPARHDVDELKRRLEQGTVKTVVILDGNPAFTAPGLGELLGRDDVAGIHLGLHADETAACCTWHLPRAHFLEAWGDGRAWDGTYALQQPLIEPLHGGRSAVEVLGLLLDTAPSSGHDLVKKTFVELLKPVDVETAWLTALRDGVAGGPGPGAPAADRVPPAGALAGARAGALAQGRAVGEGGLEAVFVPDRRIWDGRFANNPWLQELPDPLSRVTWDNVVQIGPETAGTLGVRHGDVVTVTRGGASLEAPVYVMPGVAAGTVVLSLGGGRRAAGQVGMGVGFDAFPARPQGPEAFAGGVAVTATGRRHLLAATQEHEGIDRVGRLGRQVRVAELVREEKVGEAPAEVHGKPPGIFDSPPLDGTHQWGMAIDLSACIGCGVCTVACQAENNIAVVGRQQVARGREMAWLRIDRYFSGEPARPRVHFAPVACQHCEKAPCEQVCPVAATIHSDEGLNQMVYNRCVGTRYCSNNCPFKVRRFNFFNYTKDLPHLRRMAINPEVTVRGRGVMEKCTYCIQRLEHAKIAARNEKRALRDGEVTTACAQACPAGAIVFGDLADPGSRVAALHRERRAYVMLAELDIVQRTRYLARVHNPSPDLEET